MLLRSSISTTKKLLKKTVHTFKSLFSGGSYHRIPKTPPYNNQNIPFSSDMIKNRSELDNFYSDFTDRWNADHHHKRKASKIKKNITLPRVAAPVKEGKVDEISYDYGGNCEKRWKEGGSKSKMESRKKEVEEKLKEIEKMDKSNVEHVLDMEEVIHYYSRLTCPAYIDIVDKFFMDMYAEIFTQL